MKENENTARSGGPSTPEGKKRSAENSFKHGLAVGRLIITGESPQDFEALLADLTSEHNPATTSEELVLHDMAKFYWLKDRAIRLQTDAWDAHFDCLDAPKNDVPKSLGVLLRYQTANERAFYKALKTLQDLQKKRKEEEGPFVSQSERKDQKFLREQLARYGPPPAECPVRLWVPGEPDEEIA